LPKASAADPSFAASFISTSPTTRLQLVHRRAETTISALMVRSGYALAIGRKRQYLVEEAAAQVAGAGMWSGSFQTPWEWRARQLEVLDE